MAKLLLIEDDLETASQLSLWLQRDRHSVEHTETGRDGLFRLYNYHYDLAIVDWNLPGLTGTEICRELRVIKPALPLLLLTSRSDLKDRVEGLDSGAMDYLVKPPTLPELSARIRSLLRRSTVTDAAVVSLGNLQMQEASRTLLISNVEVHLSPIEFDLLLILLKSSDSGSSKDVLVRSLWSDRTAEATSNLRVQIANLRKKLKSAGSTVIIEFTGQSGYILRPAHEDDQ